MFFVSQSRLFLGLTDESTFVQKSKTNWSLVLNKQLRLSKSFLFGRTKTVITLFFKGNNFTWGSPNPPGTAFFNTRNDDNKIMAIMFTLSEHLMKQISSWNKKSQKWKIFINVEQLKICLMRLLIIIQLSLAFQIIKKNSINDWCFKDDFWFSPNHEFFVKVFLQLLLWM